MSQHTNASPARTATPTLGLDLGSRKTYFVNLNATSQVDDEGNVETSRAALGKLLGEHQGSRVVLEASSQARWIRDLAEARGHEVIVANPRQIPLITANVRKSDRNDARLLAELGQVRPALLSPVELREERFQSVRHALFARDILVAKRTSLVTFVRSLVKEVGERLPTCDADSFAKKMGPLLPASQRAVLEPMLDVIGALTQQIKRYDKQLEELSAEQFPETSVLRQVYAVGPLTALAFVATIGDPARFRKSRTVGAYLGLVPGSKQSGEYNPEMRITKCGDAYMRRLLVSSASKLLGPFGPDSDLRRFGLRILDKGGKRARSRARIAVARKLAVLLHSLLKTGEVYEPLRTSEVAA